MDKESSMSVDEQSAYRINYVELYTHDIAVTKAFYGRAVGWDFQDWGPSDVGFTDECGIEGASNSTRSARAYAARS